MIKILIITLIIWEFQTKIQKKINRSYTEEEIIQVIEPKGIHLQTLIWINGLNVSQNVFGDDLTFVPAGTKLVIMYGPIRKVTIFNNTLHNSWFNSIRIRQPTIQQQFGNISLSDANESRDFINRIIDREIDILGDSTKLFLSGYSQGCCMSLYCGLSYPKPLGAILCFSGFLFPNTYFNPANKQIPISFTMGVLDQVLQISIGKESCHKLKQEGYSVQEKWIENQDHFLPPRIFKETIHNFFETHTKL